jgi:serpin B
MKTPLTQSARSTVLGTAVLLALLGIGSAPPYPPNPPISVPDLSERINGFTLDWLRRCAQGTEGAGNVILSPQSVFHGLAMSYIASGGATRNELARVLHFPPDDAKLMNELSELRRSLQARPGMVKEFDISLANSVWLDSTHASFQKDYLQNLNRAFDTPLHPVKFEDAAKVAGEINAWVSENARGKIPKAVSPEDFASRSRPGVIDEPALVTVNAVFFKADWGSKFDKSSTRPRPFRVANGASQDSQMMRQKSLLSYAENEQLKFLEIPYIGCRYSMYLLLPKEVLPVPKLMALVSTNTVLELVRHAWRHSVDVLLPKFEIGTHQSLNEGLAEMGVTAAFDAGRANFDRMIVKKFETSRIYLSKVSHDAWIEVHEEGTQAAAATRSHHFGLGCSASMSFPPVEFHADHPFLFLVVHNESRSIVFAGWLAKPPKT